MSIRSILRKIQKIFKTRPIFKMKGIIRNKSHNSEKKIIVLKKIKLKKNHRISIQNHTKFFSGKKCNYNIIDFHGNIVATFNPNTKVVFKNLSAGTYFIYINLPSNTTIQTKNIVKSISGEKVDESIKNTFNGKILLIAPGYPSVGNEYSFGFVHTRMKAYRNLGLEIDLAVVNELYIEKNEYYEFEGIKVNCIGFDELRVLLHNKKYQKILIHFFLTPYAQILESVDTSESIIYIYSHGVDTMYWDYPIIARQYFKPKIDYLQKTLNRDFNEKDGIIDRFNQRNNIHWIFNTNYALENSQKLTQTKYRNVSIIPSPVDEDVFYFRKREPEDRKKICVIRTFNNLSTYSIDIAVRVILELSKKPFFNKLSFDIYGDGEMHNILVEPLKGFSNIKIHQYFLEHNKMADMYRNHGIALFPTRYDTQGVAACEAAMTGSVVITSNGEIGTKECINTDLGTYCQTEKIEDYVSVIEKIYNDEKYFLGLSQKMHESVFNTCSSKHSLNKDIELIKKKPEKINFLPSFTHNEQEPILTIAIPAYNVEKYLKNSVYSLITHELVCKMEIIIINDGSRDKTSEIGKQLEKLTKTQNGSIVRLIDKENGGHGSTINVAIKHARGKYFRIMDGDDYFDTKSLFELIKILEKEDSDIVLTNYVEDLSVEGTKKSVMLYDFMEPGVQYDLDFMHYKGYGFNEWGPLLSTTTCKISILRKADFRIDENCFYVDMEYNFMVYVAAHTISYYPLNIYNYYIGREGQSMSIESRKRNILHHEKVCLRLLDEFQQRKNVLSDGKKQYIINKIIIPMCNSQYYISTYYFNKNKFFLSFDRKFKKYSYFYYHPRIAGKLIRLHRLTGGATIKMNSILDKIFRQKRH